MQTKSKLSKDASVTGIYSPSLVEVVQDTHMGIVLHPTITIHTAELGYLALEFPTAEHLFNFGEKIVSEMYKPDKTTK